MLGQNILISYHTETDGCIFFASSVYSGRIRTGKKEEFPCLNSEQISCKQCGKKFSQKRNLDRHIKVVHENIKLFPCICGKLFGSKQEMERHVKLCSQKNLEGFCCPKCRGQFDSMETMYDHLKSCEKIDLKSNEFDCEKCGEKFQEKESLSRHLFFIHQHEKDFICPKCDIKLYGNQETLLQHLRNCNNVPQETNVAQTFVCLCGKFFSTEHILHDHVKNCEKSVQNMKSKTTIVYPQNYPVKNTAEKKPNVPSSAFTLPQNVPPNKEKFPCKHCGKQLSSKTSLKNHLEKICETKTFPWTFQSRQLDQDNVRNKPKTFVEQSQNHANPSLIIQQNKSMNSIHASTLNEKYEQNTKKIANGAKMVKFTVNGTPLAKDEVYLKKIQVNTLEKIDQKTIDEAYEQKPVQSRTHNGYSFSTIESKFLVEEV